MTELRERMLSAERSVTAASGLEEAKQQVFRGVRRRRTARTVGVAAAVLVVAGVTAVGAAKFVDEHRPIPPAIQPTLIDSPSVTRLEPGEVPPGVGASRMWDEVDDRWSLALLDASSTPYGGQAVGPYALALVAPDGRAATVATFDAPGESQLLAWDPVFRTALLSTSPYMSTPESEDAELALISLDGGDNSWTAECLDTGRIGGASALQAAAPVNGGYAVRDGCGEEFFLEGGTVRRQLTDEQHRALLNAVYPGMSLTDVVIRDTQAELHFESSYTVVGLDASRCSLLVRPRTGGAGVGCADGRDFTIDEGKGPVTIKSLPGAEGSVSIVGLCGTDSVFGTLSDGSYGVGMFQGGYARPLKPSGEPVTTCRDGRYTWYIAGGDLFVGATDHSLTRLIDLDPGPGGYRDGLGVVAVAPAPYDPPLG